MRFLPSPALPLLIAVALLGVADAGAATVCRTNGSGLNLRSSGSIHANRRATLPAGSSFEVIGRSSNGSWLRVNAGGRTGWVHASYTCGPGAGASGVRRPSSGGGYSLATGPSVAGGASVAGSSSNTGSSTAGASSASGAFDPSRDALSAGGDASSDSLVANGDASSTAVGANGEAPAPANGPGVTASPAECAANVRQPAFDPLAGIDRYCESCVASRLESLGLTIADLTRVQGSVDRVEDTLGAFLGAVETGSRTPRYESITVDSGGLTYGFYQADRRSGELSKLLKRYVELAQPTNETRAISRYADQLANGRGAGLDRNREFHGLLKRAANDPAMQRAQTEFFRSHHLEPSLAKAAALGLRSPLGVSLYLDIQVNGGINSIVATAKRQVPRVQTAADEARFIRALIDARDARYRRLARNGMRKYLDGWLSRNGDFRRLLNAGNLDLVGNVPVHSKGFALCGGTPADAAAFRAHMTSLAANS